MKRFFAILALAALLVAACAFPAAAVTPDTSLNQRVYNAIYGMPYIDGVVDEEWEHAQIQKLTNVYQNDEITPPSKAQFRCMWDSTYLYFLVEVEDPTMGDLEWENKMLGGNLWKRDGVSFTFSPDYNRTVTSGQVAPAFWFIIGAYGNTANWNQVPDNVFISEDENATKMFAISYQTDANNALTGYTIEMKVNLRPRYEGIQMDVDTLIGFDIFLNDNNPILLSASRNYGLSWSDGTAGSYKNDSMKGTIQLMAKDVKYENTTEVETTTEEPVTEESTTVTEEVTSTEEPTTEEITTEATEVTTAGDTDKEESTAKETEAATTAQVSSSGDGCSSVIAGGSVLTISLISLAGTMLLKKKEY